MSASAISRLHSPSRGAGLLLGGATFLALVAVAHHPVVQSGDRDVLLAAIDHIRTADHLVHGALIGLLLAFMAGFFGFVETQRTGRAAMRVGLLLYVAGCAGGIGAAIIDGFVVPDLARHFLAAPADEQRVAYDLIVFAGIMIQDVSKFAFILMSAGILVWAVTLLLGRSRMRLVGLVGLAAGGGPALLLIGTGMILRPAELVGILLAQAAWNGCVAGGMIRLGRE